MIQVEISYALMIGFKDDNMGRDNILLKLFDVKSIIQFEELKGVLKIGKIENTCRGYGRIG